MTTPSTATPSVGSTDQPISIYEMIKEVSKDMLNTLQFQGASVQLMGSLTAHGNNVMSILQEATKDFVSNAEIVQDLGYASMAVGMVAGIGGGLAGGIEAFAEASVVAQIGTGVAMAAVSLPQAVFLLKQGAAQSQKTVAQGMNQLISKQVESQGSVTKEVTNSENGMGSQLLQEISSEGNTQRSHR